MRNSAAILFVAASVTQAAAAQDGAPLSAIDWLSDSVSLPAALPAPVAEPADAQPPVTDNALPEPITVTRLDDLPAAPAGLFPAAARGLPDDLWSDSDIAEIQRALRDLRAPRLAASQALLHDMLSAQTDWSGTTADGQKLFQARVDALLALGAVGPARSLLDIAGREEPRNFRRWFDIALLTGQENTGCSAMRRLPQITPTYPARVFCLARGGDWRAAALTLETARSLDVINEATAERLRLFLDDLADAPTMPPPSDPSPLDFAIYGAVGEPLRTGPLPLAFAHADLRPITGWKARIEAAERLARAGAIRPQRLWEVYGERLPAASGKPWDRVDAVQRLDRAIETGDPGAVSSALPRAWAAMRAADLLPALAKRHAAALDRLPLTGHAAPLAAKASLLAGQSPSSPVPAFLAALSTGGGLTAAAQTPLETAIADGMGAGQLSSRGLELVEMEQTAQGILHAVDLLDQGAEGNLDAVRQGLALLRALGLGDRARQAAIEIAIREPAA